MAICRHSPRTSVHVVWMLAEGHMKTLLPLVPLRVEACGRRALARMAAWTDIASWMLPFSSAATMISQQSDSVMGLEGDVSSNSRSAASAASPMPRILRAVLPCESIHVTSAAAAAGVEPVPPSLLAWVTSGDPAY